MWNRMFGPMGWAYWVLILTNIAIPQATLWWRKCRRQRLVAVRPVLHHQYRMWFERFVIVVTSLYRDYLPSSWAPIAPPSGTYMTFIGPGASSPPCSCSSCASCP